MGVLTDLNYDKIKERIIYSLQNSDTTRICNYLSSIKENTLCLGIGGSNATAIFASKILQVKNQCNTKCIDACDLKYYNSLYDNIFLVSHSARNYGIVNALNSRIQNKYLLSTRETAINNEVLLTYIEEDKEKSFISLANTFIPMTILLNYYMGDCLKFVTDELNSKSKIDVIPCSNIEIITDFGSITASKFLETSIIEAGLATCVVHSKYNYCHGRTTLINNTRNSTLIYFNTTNSKLDKTILENVSDLYNQVIILESKYNDPILDDFSLSIKSMYLLKEIAKKNNLDLSKVNYAKVVKYLYHFKGDM